MPIISGLDTAAPGVIDPVAAAVLQQLAATPRFCDMEVADARTVVSTLAADFAGEAPQMSSVTTRRFHRGDLEVEVHVFVPTNARPEAGAVLYVHGGGFITGSPVNYQAAVRGLADALGRTVVVPAYPLSPEARFPTALDHVEAAYHWLVEGTEHDYLAAGGNVVVAGDSAGGNLTAALVNRLAGGSSMPAAQVLLYPATNFADLDTESIQKFGTGHFITRDDLVHFMEQYLPEGLTTEEPEVSPLLAVSADTPPTLVITAEFDPLRSDGEGYARRLQELGVPVEYACAAGQIHAFGLLPGLFPAAAEANGVIAAYLARVADNT